MDILDRKQKKALAEINWAMSEAFREDIMNDCGHPKLRAKALDLITKLRMEANILNAQKTAKAPPPVDVPQNIALSKLNSDGIEKLGLDENG